MFSQGESEGEGIIDSWTDVNGCVVRRSNFFWYFPFGWTLLSSKLMKCRMQGSIFRHAFASEEDMDTAIHKFELKDIDQVQWTIDECFSPET